MNKAVVGLVIKDNKVLVGKKTSNSKYFLNNCWHIPGGKVEINESEETALKREIKEEANIEVAIINKIATSIQTENNLEVTWYLAKYVSGKLKASDDLREIKFIDKTEVSKTCDPKAVSVWPKEIYEFLE